MIETLIGMVLAIVIAFVYTWVLSLVILGVVPIVLVAGALEVKALTGHTIENKKALETAGKVIFSIVYTDGEVILKNRVMCRQLDHNPPMHVCGWVGGGHSGCVPAH